MGYRLKVQIKIRDENREFLMRAMKRHTRIFTGSEIKGGLSLGLSRGNPRDTAMVRP